MRGRERVEEINWRSEATLFRRQAGARQRPVTIARGRLSEMVHVAMLLSDEERRELAIAIPSQALELDHDAISHLADRPDFPIII
jgi:hypothetical protein